MKPRSHSLNQVVWVTMTAIDAVPTTRVQMNAKTWSDLRVSDMEMTYAHSAFGIHHSKCLTDAEVEAPPTRFRLAVDAKTRNPIQLVAEVDPRGAERGQVPQ